MVSYVLKTGCSWLFIHSVGFCLQALTRCAEKNNESIFLPSGKPRSGKQELCRDRPVRGNGLTRKEDKKQSEIHMLT